MRHPVISLLTDFGARDPSGAILHGVIATIAPDVRVIDISHEVRKFAIRDGALLLWCALPYLPVGVHVGVVDPGVGTSRRPIAILTGRGDVLIGPDNGLLIAATTRLGGLASARLLEAPEYRLPVVSTSFHGRDIFAPAAAHLARGAPFESLGPELDATTLAPSPIADATVEPGRLGSSIVYVDTFGNVKLAGLRADLEAALGAVRPGDRLELTVERAADPPMTAVVRWVAAFGDVAPGSPLLYEDSYGRICLAENQGNVAVRLGLAEDLSVRIRRAEPRPGH
ncbi:MAG TPA: SAM-dependent chlorinase/fluorinase [Candidatus Limnocylindrales bacterium]|nr:SAM-dependent chlorinase/fluorinase [Candidatus Limnocylindrales bacterium]